jgi:hypothetical protein
MVSKGGEREGLYDDGIRESLEGEDDMKLAC